MYLANGEKRQETATQKDMLNGRFVELRTQIAACHSHLMCAVERDRKHRFRNVPVDDFDDHCTRTGPVRMTTETAPWACPRFCHCCSIANSCRTYLKLQLSRITESSGGNVAVSFHYEGGRTGWQGMRGWSQRNYHRVDSMEEYWGES